MHISDQKQELRDSLRTRLSRMSEKDRRVENNSLCKQILKAINAEPKATIAAYMPMADEADIKAALKIMLKSGVNLYLPCLEHGRLVFRKTETVENLPKGSFGIPQPPESQPQLDPKALQIALIPGRGFDRKGNRIGRGNGGYDKWMEMHKQINPQTKYIGVCLECQMVNEIPTEPHDQKMDDVITARGSLKTS